MTPEQIEAIRERIAESNPEALLADGFEDAIIGVAERCGQPTLVVYDCHKCLDILMQRDGMDHEEALEFFMFNTTGAWVGENTPLFMWPFNSDEIGEIDECNHADWAFDKNGRACPKCGAIVADFGD